MTGYVYNFLYRCGSISTCTPYEVDLPPGIYRFEAWGAQGGNTGGRATGGKGGYAAGDITLKKSQHFYIYVGSKGSSYPNPDEFAYNGGGRGLKSGAGGGATDFRVISDSLYHRIMVAGGGGSVCGIYRGSESAVRGRCVVYRRVGGSVARLRVVVARQLGRGAVAGGVGLAPGGMPVVCLGICLGTGSLGAPQQVEGHLLGGVVAVAGGIVHAHRGAAGEPLAFADALSLEQRDGFDSPRGASCRAQCAAAGGGRGAGDRPVARCAPVPCSGLAGLLRCGNHAVAQPHAHGECIGQAVARHRHPRER